MLTVLDVGSAKNSTASIDLRLAQSRGKAVKLIRYISQSESVRITVLSPKRLDVSEKTGIGKVLPGTLTLKLIEIRRPKSKQTKMPEWKVTKTRKPTVTSNDQ